MAIKYYADRLHNKNNAAALTMKNERVHHYCDIETDLDQPDLQKFKWADRLLV